MILAQRREASSLVSSPETRRNAWESTGQKRSDLIPSLPTILTSRSSFRRRSSRRSSPACRAQWYAPVYLVCAVLSLTPFPQDVSNFDTVFTTEAPLDSVVEGSQLSQTVQAQFAGKAASLNENGRTADTTMHDRILLRRYTHARQPIVNHHAPPENSSPPLHLSFISGLHMYTIHSSIWNSHITRICCSECLLAVTVCLYIHTLSLIAPCCSSRSSVIHTPRNLSAFRSRIHTIEYQRRQSNGTCSVPHNLQRRVLL